jgi:hypothetical protein
LLQRERKTEIKGQRDREDRDYELKRESNTDSAINVKSIRERAVCDEWS